MINLPSVYSIVCNCCNQTIGSVFEPDFMKPGVISSKPPSKRSINKLLKEHRLRTNCNPYKVIRNP